MAKNIIICDLDGTLCDISHRLHYIESEDKDWDAFFKACVDDDCYVDVLRVVENLCGKDNKLVFVSGRSDVVEGETREWLDDTVAVEYELRMRKAGDHRPDHEVKAEMTADLKPEDVWLVLDDRDQVVKMWRERGFRCLQVADGSF